MKDIFDKTVSEELNNRLAKLTSTTKPLWGKMSVDQMLAHCSVVYEMTYEDKHPKPSGFKKFLLTALIKNTVVGEKPYKKNSPTATQFRQTEKKNFEIEKNRLVEHINKTQSLGKKHFENRESHSFGKLTSGEWSNMFYKHLDHHLKQFGV